MSGGGMAGFFTSSQPNAAAVGSIGSRNARKKSCPLGGVKKSRYTLLCEANAPILSLAHGGVAQLVRAPACHVGGRGFESRHPRFSPPTILWRHGFKPWGTRKTCGSMADRETSDGNCGSRWWPFPVRPDSHGLPGLAGDRGGTAIVTGAASGLGRAVVRRLLERGWCVAAVDLPGSTRETLDGGLSEAAGRLLKMPFDVRDVDGWQRLHKELRSRWTSLDLLVNAAGVGATGRVGELPSEQWRRLIETNLLGTAFGCETFLPWLAAGGTGGRRSSLVNVASITGLLAVPSMASYSASKAGVTALSEAIAAERGRGSPAVTIVCPGFFRSGLLETWHFVGDCEAQEARRRMAATSWTSERVAEELLAASAAGRRYLVVGAKARWLWRLKRLTPTAVTTLLHCVYRRL
jgi:NAD(P)-dependent dehydrogenase (short-subunit alcohol dehydrogenase family)